MGGVLSTNERREEVISWAQSFLFRNQLEAPDGIQDLKLILAIFHDDMTFRLSIFSGV